MELADKLLERKYSYVVTTHIDRRHVHNHIIFCAADNINHEKYHGCKKTYYNIHNLSDTLCWEHELFVITPWEKHGKTYKEWQSGKNGSAWEEQLKSDIDKAIRNAATYEDCIELILTKGYEVKGEDFEEKHINLFHSARWTARVLFVSTKSL